MVNEEIIKKRGKIVQINEIIVMDAEEAKVILGIAKKWMEWIENVRKRIYIERDLLVFHSTKLPNEIQKDKKKRKTIINRIIRQKNM